MSTVSVIMPQMGESITEGTITKWHKKVGEKVTKDETLLEISTDKVDSEIPSPFTGVLSKILVEEQKTVPVQTVIAEIETDVAAAATAEAPHPAPAARKEPIAPPVAQAIDRAPSSTRSAPQTAVAQVAHKPEDGGSPRADRGRFYSPLVMNIAQQEGISLTELERIPGTGAEGRVSKNDVLEYLKSRTTAPAPSTSTTSSSSRTGVAIDVGPSSKGKPVDDETLRVKYPAPQNEILQMSNVIQRMAEHMVHSWNTAPHVSAISEADMTKIVNYRQRHAAAFEEHEGFKLTYTHFIMDAMVKAVKDYPLVNSTIEGDKIILKKYINLGMAVASDNGLIVPVIKNAEEKNFVGLARAINDLAQRTRAKKLTPDDISGGTITITNYGVFGNIIGTPIINPPQVAILGVGAFQKRPVVIDDAIAIRTMTYLTLMFDHRIVDGALGGMFLQRVIKYLEEFDTEQTI